MISRRQLLFAGSLLSLLASVSTARAEQSVRLATLASGTVAWEVDTIIRNGFDKKHGLSLSIVPVAGKMAADVLLAGGNADVIVTDWIWVSRQRNAGADYTFLSYSRQVGSILVAERSSIKTLDNLQGKTIGIAGGPTDKSWILIQALAKKKHNIDLAKNAVPIFAAPPLLNEKLLSGEIDSVITFWHFAAVLKAKGARDIATIADAARLLGLDADTPLLGYVFSETWSRKNDNIAMKLAAASRDAKSLLARDDTEWNRLRPLMNAKTDAEFEALKAGFRAGIPADDRIDINAAEKLFAVLAEYGGPALVGDSPTLASGTFASH